MCGVGVWRVRVGAGARGSGRGRGTMHVDIGDEETRKGERLWDVEGCESFESKVRYVRIYYTSQGLGC